MDQTASLRDTDQLARTLRSIAVAAFALLLCWLLSGILPLIFMAVLIAVMLRGASDWAAERTHTSPLLMVAVIALLSTAAFFGFLYYLGPQLVAQLSDLWDRLQHIETTLRDSYGQTPIGHRIFQAISSAGGGVSQHIAAYATDIATFTLGGALWLFIVVVTALYLAVTPELYVGGAVRLFPLRFRPRARKVFADIGRTLEWWSLGQLIDMAVVGSLATLGLYLLGVPLPLALGALAGLLTFIPYFGSIASAVPAMLVALTVSWQDSVWTLGIFLICHGIEGYIVAPLVQRRMVHLPPALTIVSMSIFGTLDGPLGVVLGSPIAAVLLIATREVYVVEVLGDPDMEGPGTFGHVEHSSEPTGAE